MKIAVATDGPVVAAHFGRCPEYTIATVNDGKVVDKVVIPNPGHEPGLLPGYLARLGVSCIIAGGMGPRAQGLFTENNIETITGVSGYVNEVVDSFLAGSLEAGESLCEHGDGEHHGEACAITEGDVLRTLGGLPEQKIHCSVLGPAALRLAILDYIRKSRRHGADGRRDVEGSDPRPQAGNGQRGQKWERQRQSPTTVRAAGPHRGDSCSASHGRQL